MSDASGQNVEEVTGGGWWLFGAYVASIGGLGWTVFSPWPAMAAPVQIAIVPLLIVAGAFGRAHYTLGLGESFDKRVPLLPLIYGAMFGLAVGAWRDFDRVLPDSKAMTAFAAAAVVGAGIAFLLAHIDRKQMGDGLMVTLTTVVASLWSAGLIVHANAHFNVRTLAQRPRSSSTKTGGAGAAESSGFSSGTAMWPRCAYASPSTGAPR